MGNIFFTSDQHFGDKSILSKRSFSTIQDMDDMMIKKWNLKIDSADEVYHLGDFADNNPEYLNKILDRLNGKIFLIKGNHDYYTESSQSRFEWVKDYHELIVNDKDNPLGTQLLVLFHYPMLYWKGMGMGTYHLYGHMHGELKNHPKPNSMDIGVDCQDYYPLSYLEVKQRINKNF